MNKQLISLFKGYSDTIPVESTIEEVAVLIKSNALVREHTEKHRYYAANGQVTAAGKEKSSCPCFAVAVRLEGGKQQKHVVAFTGLGIVDIDHVPAHLLAEVVQRINQDPHTHLAYITISGEGIRIIFRIDGMTGDLAADAKNYAKLFKEVNRYYSLLTECECDLKCRNINRLSGLAHDPQVYYNPQAEPFCPEDFKEEKPQRSAPKKRTEKLLKRAVTAAQKELAAQEVVYAPHQHNEYIMRMGYLLNAYGVDCEAAIAWGTTEFADCDANVDSIFRSCYSQTQDHGCRTLPRSSRKEEENNYYAGVEEIEAFLETQASFRFNIVTGKVEYFTDQEQHLGKKNDVDDRFVNTLWRRMCKQVNPARINDIRYILHSEFVPLYNPFEAYFKDLPSWDGTTDYIAQVAAGVHVTSDQATFTEYFRKWFVAMVAALLDDEVVNHEILVLIGPQGTYKTTWCNYLLPPELRHYFYTKVSLDKFSKDDLFTLTEFAVVCLEEIDVLRPEVLARIKAMTTEKIINERRAYGHYKEHRPHIASYCGTSNNLHFLTDCSNRRWLPFEIEHIDNPLTHPLPYRELYAQAYALWKGGFHYWFDAQEIEALNVHNSAFEAPNLERDLILTYFRRPMPGEECIFATTAHILGRINGAVKHLLNPTRIGIIMKQAGFELKRTSTQRGYRVVELSEEEVRRNKRAIARYTEEPKTDKDDDEDEDDDNDDSSLNFQK